MSKTRRLMMRRMRVTTYALRWIGREMRGVTTRLRIWTWVWLVCCKMDCGKATTGWIMRIKNYTPICARWVRIWGKCTKRGMRLLKVVPKKQDYRAVQLNNMVVRPNSRLMYQLWIVVLSQNLGVRVGLIKADTNQINNEYELWKINNNISKN